MHAQEETAEDRDQIYSDLERILGQPIDEPNKQILQTLPPSLLGDELLWRVEALHDQVLPPPAAILFHPIGQFAASAQTDLQTGHCGLCGEITSKMFRCTACAYAVSLVLHQPILLQKAAAANAPRAQEESQSFFL